MNPNDSCDSALAGMTIRLLNESAIHAHALECSRRYRAGKFTRVGQDFMDEVKTDVDNLIRNVRNQIQTLHPVIEPEKEKCFITRALCDKVMGEMNRLIGRIIQNKIQRHPTVGKTLGRTR